MKWARSQTGFTIVELLIVVVVIAILAAITIVSYNGIQNRAYDSSVQNDLEANGKRLLLYAAENGSLPLNITVLTAKVSKQAYLISRNNLYFCINSSTGRFSIAGISKSGNTYQNVDGSVSKAASQLWGADTCALIGSGTLHGAYDQSGGTGWQSWVSG